MTDLGSHVTLLEIGTIAMESLNILELMGNITEQEQNHWGSPPDANQLLPVSYDVQAPDQDQQEQCYVHYLQEAVGSVLPQNLPPSFMGAAEEEGSGSEPP